MVVTDDERRQGMDEVPVGRGYSKTHGLDNPGFPRWIGAAGPKAPEVLAKLPFHLLRLFVLGYSIPRKGLS